MHYMRCHPNLEVSFFEALAYSANGMTWHGHPRITGIRVTDAMALFRAYLWERRRQGEIQFSGVSASRRAFLGTKMYGRVTNPPWHLYTYIGSLPLALAAEPECENAANGAILWHLSRVMYDIDVHRNQREHTSKPRAQPFSMPPKILDGLLSCVFFGIHLMYRERLHRAHPASHAPLADFRTFVRAILVEWSSMAAVISMASEVLFTYIFLQTRIY